MDSYGGYQKLLVYGEFFVQVLNQGILYRSFRCIPLWLTANGNKVPAIWQIITQQEAKEIKDSKLGHKLPMCSTQFLK